MTAVSDCLKAIERFGKRAAYVLKFMAGDLREAARCEYEYCREVQTSAILVLTWACTSRCKTCTAWRRRDDRATELTCEEWLEVGRELAARGVRDVELFGGDVFLRKDVVIKLTELLNSLGCRVYIPTNGNLMNEDTARHLAKSLHALYISVDGLDEAHDEVRGMPGTFERTRRALKLFRSNRGGARYPKLVCNTTVSKYNVNQLVKIAEFACNAGFDRIELGYVGELTEDHVQNSRIGDYLASPIYIRSGESSLVRKEALPLLREQLRQAKASFDGRQGPMGRFKVKTTDVDILSDREVIEGTVPPRRCMFERTTVFIDPYGNVIPCLFFDTYGLGNVRHGALDRPRTTEALRRFRRHQESGQLMICRHCIMSVLRNCSGLDVLHRAYIDGQSRPL